MKSRQNVLVWNRREWSTSGKRQKLKFFPGCPVSNIVILTIPFVCQVFWSENRIDVSAQSIPVHRFRIVVPASRMADEDFREFLSFLFLTPCDDVNGKVVRMFWSDK